MTKADVAFETSEIAFSYRGQKALSGLSLKVQKGERIALIGANGSGKSTLLRLLAGLSFPDAGSISLFGEELTAKRLEEEQYFFRFRRRVGILFQNPDIQLFNASVFDEVAFGPLQMGWPPAQVRKLVHQALEEMGITELRSRAPHRLSGGEKKRVALASVLVLDPEVLLLDEPTAALDPHSDDQMINLLKSWGNGRKTVITATHDLDTLEDIADRCYVLDNGRIAAEGTPLTILHDTRMLAGAKLIRPQHHTHSHETTAPHPHVHTTDIG